MSAPIWRFALPPGFAGPSSVFGVLMVSVDKVGRKFPLTLAATGPLAPQEAQASYEALEGVALAALEDDMTKERLTKELAALPALPAGGAPARQATWSTELDGAPLHFETSTLPTAAQALHLFDPVTYLAEAAP